MAKLSSIRRNEKRKKLVIKYEAKRIEYKKNKDYDGLQKLPRNSSPARIQNRCSSCGRPHAVYRDLMLCRICFRSFFVRKLLPGITKSSW